MKWNYFLNKIIQTFFWIFSQPQTMCAAAPIRRKIVKIMIMQFNFSLRHFRIKALRSVWQLNHPVLHMRIRRRKKSKSESSRERASSLCCTWWSCTTSITLWWCPRSPIIRVGLTQVYVSGARPFANTHTPCVYFGGAPAAPCCSQCARITLFSVGVVVPH